MRFVVALLSFVLLSGAAAQQSHRYLGTDARVGVYPRWMWPIFPEVNCVQGHGGKAFAHVSVTCDMTLRFAVLGLAVGMLLQSCTIQKRSHLPGWHVERATHHVGHREAAMSSEVPEELDVVVNLEAEPVAEAFEVAVVPAPLPSLEAFVPEDIGASEPKLQTLDFRSSWCESSHVNHVVSEEEVETAPENSGGLGRVAWRVLLGVVAAVFGVNGIRVVQMGLGWWDSVGWSWFGMSYSPEGSLAVLLLGVVLHELAWRALLWRSQNPRLGSFMVR